MKKKISMDLLHLKQLLDESGSHTQCALVCVCVCLTPGGWGGRKLNTGLLTGGWPDFLSLSAQHICRPRRSSGLTGEQLLAVIPFEGRQEMISDATLHLQST